MWLFYELGIQNSRINSNAEKKASLFHSCLQILPSTSGGKCFSTTHGRGSVQSREKPRMQVDSHPCGIFMKQSFTCHPYRKTVVSLNLWLKTCGFCPPHVLSELFTQRTQPLLWDGCRIWLYDLIRTLMNSSERKAAPINKLGHANIYQKEPRMLCIFSSTYCFWQLHLHPSIFFSLSKNH